MKLLTDQQIRSAKPRKSAQGKPIKYELIDSTRQRGVGRLVVKISTSGAKCFAYKYKFAKKWKYIQLGKFPALSLSDARQAIIPFINMLNRGEDPKIELERLALEKKDKENARAKQGDISQLFKAYTEKMKRDEKRTYKAVLSSLEKEVYPLISPETKAKDVSRTQIKEVLANIIRRGARTQSNRIRSYLMAAFNFGLQHDNDPNALIQKLTFGIGHNPVDGIPKQKDAERVGDNYLVFEETAHLLNTFRYTPRVGYMCNALMHLCFHTGGQRPHELVASKWSSINWGQKTLLITASVSKNKRDHIVPLSESALSILKMLKHMTSDSEFIFSQTPNKTMHLRTDSFSTSIRRYREDQPDFNYFVARDIRRTCKTLMGEIGISKEIRDRLQNHALNDVSSKHYDRYDYLVEKRKAVELWEKRLLEMISKDN